MKFSVEDFGAALGTIKNVEPLPATIWSPKESEPTPEDLETLPCYVRFKRGGMWFTINQTRSLIAEIMNGTGGYILEDKRIVEYCPFQHEGSEINIMYIYDVEKREWRLE